MASYDGAHSVRSRTQIFGVEARARMKLGLVHEMKSERASHDLYSYAYTCYCLRIFYWRR